MSHSQRMKDLLAKAVKLYGLNGVHPAAEIMPFMAEEEFDSLVEDADKNGFQNSVKVTKDRLLIDGRNRICASIVLEKDVHIEEFTPYDPIQYVISENLERRHLTSQQKAAIAVQADQLYKLLAEQAKERQGERTDLKQSNDITEKIQESKPISEPVKRQERETATKMAKAFGTNQNYVSKAKKVQEHAPDLLPKVASGEVDLNDAAKEAGQRKKEVQGEQQEVGARLTSQQKAVIAVQAESGTPQPKSANVLPFVPKAPAPQKPSGPDIETVEVNGYTLHIWKDGAAKSAFNTANDSIDWAWSTWNPVTGCLHGCNYCYAARIATNERMAAVYPKGFEPVYHPYRLDAPKNSRQFTEQDILREAQKRRLDADQAKQWAKNVFVCSMADLFGKWVPDEWILSVFDSVVKYDQWNYLFLTKYPQRLQEIGEKLGGSFPDNCWVGTTVDEQKRVKIAQDAFANIKAPVKWLSLEPLLTNLQFSDLGMFDMVAIGAETDGNPYCNSCGQVDPKRIKFTPPWEWVENILWQARQSGTAVYLKENLKCRPKEMPTPRKTASGGQLSFA